MTTFLDSPDIRPPWYVADMDSILAVCAGKDEALAWCRTHLRDTRVVPDYQRMTQGMYSYSGPAADGPGTSKTLWYGTREAMIFNGFDMQMAAWEEVKKNAVHD